MEYRDADDRQRLESLLLDDARPSSRMELVARLGGEVQVVS
jgi:hypothetical protein